MYSTELLLWKNQKGSICYPITLFKRDLTADIFIEMFNFLWARYFKKQLQTTDCKGLLFAKWDPGPSGGTQDPGPFVGT